MVTFHGHDHEERAPSPLSLFEQPANRFLSELLVVRRRLPERLRIGSTKVWICFGEIKADLRENKGDANLYDDGGLDRIAGLGAVIGALEPGRRADGGTQHHAVVRGELPFRSLLPPGQRGTRKT